MGVRQHSRLNQVGSNSLGKATHPNTAGHDDEIHSSVRDRQLVDLYECECALRAFWALRAGVPYRCWALRASRHMVMDIPLKRSFLPVGPEVQYTIRCSTYSYRSRSPYLLTRSTGQVLNVVFRVSPKPATFASACCLPNRPPRREALVHLPWLLRLRYPCAPSRCPISLRPSAGHTASLRWRTACLPHPSLAILQ